MWVGWRPSDLHIHRRKAVTEILIPESSQSSLIATDPFLTVALLQSAQSVKSRFSELEDYKAAIEDINNRLDFSHTKLIDEWLQTGVLAPMNFFNNPADP